MQMLTANDAQFAFGCTLIAAGIMILLVKWAWRDNNIFKLLGAVVLLRLVFGRRNRNDADF